jgi:hypothetical protein
MLRVLGSGHDGGVGSEASAENAHGHVLGVWTSASVHDGTNDISTLKLAD